MIAISISLSLDALGIGISYKLKGVKITTTAKLVIGVVSILIMWAALEVGELLIQVVPCEVANIVGIVVLIIIGLTFIRNALYGGDEAKYDFNNSKKIDFVEAAALGFALSADSVSAGIAAVTMGLGGAIIPFMVGGMQVMFLCLAEILLEECHVIQKMNKKVCGVFSGCLLIMIALLRVVK